jgi:hypothetical protein
MSCYTCRCCWSVRRNFCRLHCLRQKSVTWRQFCPFVRFRWELDRSSTIVITTRRAAMRRVMSVTVVRHGHKRQLCEVVGMLTAE